MYLWLPPPCGQGWLRIDKYTFRKLFLMQVCYKIMLCRLPFKKNYECRFGGQWNLCWKQYGLNSIYIKLTFIYYLVIWTLLTQKDNNIVGFTFIFCFKCKLEYGNPQCVAYTVWVYAVCTLMSCQNIISNPPINSVKKTLL